MTSKATSGRCDISPALSGEARCGSSGPGEVQLRLRGEVRLRRVRLGRGTAKGQGSSFSCCGFMGTVQAEWSYLRIALWMYVRSYYKFFCNKVWITREIWNWSNFIIL
ncbi:unnamed protein product [Miscanthus lutarioriparius]|uniref:Uncharacterized protein n=1 Tax=Miscanthus lutarioriparius TaxID=422564 RepID=A0A811MNQ7_9POAL|nr:unnamed protein product [Miscanthus lutarioriparius]